MFAYCNNNPANFQDHAGAKMEYVKFDCGAPVAFPSSSVGYAYGITAPVAPDSIENIWNNVQDDLLDFSIVAGVALSLVGTAGTLGIIAIPKAVEHFKNSCKRETDYMRVLNLLAIILMVGGIICEVAWLFTGKVYDYLLIAGIAIHAIGVALRIIHMVMEYTIEK